jgi:hypothetical protein
MSGRLGSLRDVLRAAHRLLTTSSAPSQAAAQESVTGQGLSAKAARAVRGEVNMPTRAVAAVLLKSSEPLRSHDLYARSSEYGFFNSRRHFKHVLRMMKEQRRIQVITGPPERVGGSKLTFTIRLTRRGEQIYTSYLGDSIPPPPAKRASGLANATE